MRILVSICAIAALSACETAYPDITLDDGPMKPAKVVAF